jgi:hypothetical protein
MIILVEGNREEALFEESRVRGSFYGTSVRFVLCVSFEDSLRGRLMSGQPAIIAAFHSAGYACSEDGIPVPRTIWY